MTTPTTSPAPKLPYRVVVLKYGIGEGIERPTKVFPQGGGDLLTPDEIGVWEYLKWLESEVERLKQTSSQPSAASTELTTAPSRLTGANIPPVVPANSNSEVRAATDDAAPTLQASELLTDPTPIDATTVEPGAFGSEGAAPSKRDLAEMELLRDPSMSNVAIGARIGVSDELVRQTRHRLQAAGRLTPVASVVRKDGTAYTISNTSNTLVSEGESGVGASPTAAMVDAG